MPKRMLSLANAFVQDAIAIAPKLHVRLIGIARILMPRAHARLSAGRSEMSDELQAPVYCLSLPWL
jgi:biotin synthase